MLGTLGGRHSILDKNPQGGDLVTFRRMIVRTPEVQRTEETADSSVLGLWLIVLIQVLLSERFRFKCLKGWSILVWDPLMVDLLNNHEHKICIHQNQKTIQIYHHASLGQHQVGGWTSPGLLWSTAEFILWVRVHNWMWTNGPDAPFMLALLLFADWSLKFT